MNRLQDTVGFIDIGLEAHYYKGIKFNGLCEHETKDDKIIPVFYKGYGDNEFVGFNDGNGLNIYHRLVTNSQEDDMEDGFGNQPMNIESFDMKLVAFGNQRDIIDSNNNINYKIADEIKELIISRLTKAQLTAIEGLSSVINPTGTNHDKKSVWAEELPEEKIKIKPETLLFSINYTIKLKFIGSCKTIACEV